MYGGQHYDICGLGCLEFRTESIKKYSASFLMAGLARFRIRGS